MEKGILRVVVTVILAIIVVMAILNFVQSILGLIMPLLVIGAVGYGLYRLTRPKSIHGGRGRFLP